MPNEDEYEQVKIREIFNKELLITGITHDVYHPKDESEEDRPYVLFYAEYDNKYVKFSTSSGVIMKQVEKLKLPCRGKFSEVEGSYGRKYYSFREVK